MNMNIVKAFSKNSNMAKREENPSHSQSCMEPSYSRQSSQSNHDEVIDKVSNLWKSIQNQENKVKTFSLLITTTGLPDCCHDVTTALQNAFKTAELGEDTCFAHHEYMVPLDDERVQGRIGKVEQHDSFIYSIKSGMKFTISPHELKIMDEVEESNVFQDCFQKENILECFKILTEIGRKITEVNLSHTSHDVEIEKLLVHGIGLVNLWEMKLDNKTVRPFLESFGKCFTRSLVWLFLDLDKDLPNIHLPLEGIKGDPKALSWRTRIEHLLRQCHLCKHSMFNKDDRNRVCTIFAIHTQQDDEILYIKRKQLQNECEDAARQMGIEELIDFDIQLLCNEGSQMVEALKKRMKCAFKQAEKHQVTIPVSWPFLRELVSLINKPWITFGELKKMAEDCKLKVGCGELNLEEFCKYYESFGSILQVKQVDDQSPYIITKTADFLNKCHKFLTQARDKYQNGIVDASANNFKQMLEGVGITEKNEFMDILTSVGIVVQKQTQPTRKYFIPTICTGERKKEVTKGSVQFVLSMSSPNVEKSGEILTAMKKQFAKMGMQTNGINSNTVVITVSEDQHEFEFELTFQGDVIEVVCANYDYTDENTLERVVGKIIQAFHDMVKKRMYRNNIKYHFAVACQANELPFLIPHQKRHILPRSRFCEECQVHRIDQAPLIKAWINELEKNDVPKELKLNGDFSPEDMSNIVKEVMKYPIEALHLLSTLLELEDVFNRCMESLPQPAWQMSEHKKMWLIYKLMVEWHQKIDEEDESPKKVLARILVQCDKKWQEKQMQEPQFCKLALRVDMQVLTLQRQEKLKKRFD